MITPISRVSFLSTPSARRATVLIRTLPAVSTISIHALREEGDDANLKTIIPAKISIHALREEGDIPLILHIHAAGNFYPRPPRGGRRPNGPCRACLLPISIHALREEGDDDRSTL